MQRQKGEISKNSEILFVVALVYWKIVLLLGFCFIR